MIKKFPIWILSVGFASILPQTSFASSEESAARSGERVAKSLPNDLSEIESASVVSIRIGAYAEARTGWSEDLFQKPAIHADICADICSVPGSIRKGWQE